MRKFAGNKGRPDISLDLSLRLGSLRRRCCRFCFGRFDLADPRLLLPAKIDTWLLAIVAVIARLTTKQVAILSALATLKLH